jgi:hypothetical protein
MHVLLPVIDSNRGREKEGMEFRDKRVGEKGLAYPAAECFEWVHCLFITRAVFVELDRARRACGGRWQRVKRRVRIFTVTLHVADFLVKLQIIRLQTSDLGAQFRDYLELLAKFLRECGEH